MRGGEIRKLLRMRLGKRRIARARRCHVVAHPLVAIRGAAAECQQRVVGGTIRVAAREAGDRLAQCGGQRCRVAYEFRKAALGFCHDRIIAECTEYADESGAQQGVIRGL